MNWKNEAVEKLKRYAPMKTSLQSIPVELARLETQACAIRGSAADKTPVKGGGNGREEAMLNNHVHRQELSWALEQAKYWVEATDMAMSILNPEERLILYRMYISPQPGAVNRLSEELSAEQSSIYRRRDAALQKFTRAFYGAVES